MASQVLSGSSNVSYTNNTGQNVRIVINYMGGVLGNDGTLSFPFYRISLSWAGVSINSKLVAIGRNLAYSNSEAPLSQAFTPALSANNALGNSFAETNANYDGALPTELMLAPGQTFSASCGPYNIVVIPEAG